MSFMAQAATAYRQAATTVSPMVALVRLYEETILLIRRTIKAVESKRFEEAFNCVSKAATILRGLRASLDYERGGGLSEMLERMYTANIRALHTAFGKKDQVIRYHKIIGGLTEMRDAWLVVARLPAGQA